MDNNYSTIIIINLIVNVLLVVDKFMSRIKKSSCFGNTIELSDTNNNLKNSDSKLNNNLDSNKILIELLQNINNNKKDDDKKDLNNNQLDKL